MQVSTSFVLFLQKFELFHTKTFFINVVRLTFALLSSRKGESHS